MNDIVVALIMTAGTVFVGALTLIGVIISNKRSNEKMTSTVVEKMRLSQAVTETKLENLTSEVREHNNFARRMPVVEADIKHMSEQIKTLQSYHTK